MRGEKLAALGIEQGSEDAARIKIRKAEPVDRPVTATRAAVRPSPITA